MKRQLAPAVASAATIVAAVVLASCGGGNGHSSGDRPATASAAADSRKARLAALPHQSSWSAPIDLGFVPAAAANVPDASGEGTGRVLLWSAENRFNFSSTGNVTWTAMFDPRTNTATAPRSNATNHNMFCPGTSNLPDGRLLVSGGSTEAATSLYTAATDRWSPAPGAVMVRPRAYQANSVLRDGSVFTLGGSWDGGIGTKGGEVWTLAAGWRALPGVPVQPFLTADVGGEYRSDNHMWLLPTAGGRLLHAGPSRNMNWIDPRGNGSFTSAGARGGDADAMNGSAVMFEPGRILVTGGAPQYSGATATASAYIIDARSPSLDAAGRPQVTRLANMAYTRVFHNSVVLPNGQVIVIGGKDRSDGFNDAGARLVSELWDPATGRFTLLPAMSVPRTYHSVALLLPDGRVLSAGSGLCNCAADQPRAQVFTPHYLYNDDGVTLATRPRITAAGRQVEYGGALSVTTDTPVASFVLMCLSSSTHTVNNDQRRVPISIRSVAGNSYVLDAPTNPGIAVPGEYMLFAIDARGVPSLSRTVRVGGGSGIGAAPLIAPVPDRSANIGSSVTLNLAASGGDAGTVAYAAAGLPPGLRLNGATGVISGAPTTAGNFVVTASAGNGAARTSTEFVRRVGGAVAPPANQPPVVSITTPANNASIEQGAAVAINANAADPGGSVVRVEFYDGTTLLGTDTTAPYSFNWLNAAAGPHSLTARAIDNAGAVSTSAAVSITVATAAPPAAAVACAVEGGTCRLPAGATATVWFGSGTRWAVRRGVSGSVACTNAVFGDPAPGVAKACRYQVTSIAVPSAPPAGATACAREGGTCTLPAGRAATVWFGAGTAWSSRTGVVGSVACSTAVFGDPAPGVVKTCRYQ